MARRETHATQYREGELEGAKTQNWMSVLGGAGLLLYGLRGSWLRLPLALGGGALIYRGLKERWPLEESWLEPTERSEIRIHRSITINRPVEEVYAFWRNLENLPRAMAHIDSITVTGNRRSHWVVKIPGKVPVEWDAEITEERENQRLSWRTLPGGSVEHSGTILFEEGPGGRGTELSLTLEYRPAGGKIGGAAAKLFNAVTSQQIKEDLRRFKSMMEAGEVPVTQGRISGQEVD